MGKIISIAHLDKKEIKRIKELENKLKICLVAYSVEESPNFSDLTEDELEEVKKLEESLGISLLAYDLKNKSVA